MYNLRTNNLEPWHSLPTRPKFSKNKHSNQTAPSQIRSKLLDSRAIPNGITSLYVFIELLSSGEVGPCCAQAMLHWLDHPSDQHSINGGPVVLSCSLRRFGDRHQWTQPYALPPKHCKCRNPNLGNYPLWEEWNRYSSRYGLRMQIVGRRSIDLCSFTSHSHFRSRTKHVERLR